MSHPLRDIGFYISKQFCYPFVCPDVLQLSITSSCNLRCKSCNVWRQPHGTEHELSLRQLKDVIDESVAWGIREVHILGGEPLIREDWDMIAAYAKKKGMTTVICTNGTLLNAGTTADRMAAAGVDMLCISIDGARPATHDFLRGESGLFEKIFQGINSINSRDAGNRPKIVMIMTVSGRNLDEMKEYVDLAKVSGACAVYFTALVLDNVNLFSKKKTHDLWIKDDRMGSLDTYFDDVRKHSESKGYYLSYPSYALFARYFRGELKKGEWPCFAGLKRLVLTPDGTVQICGVSVGNYNAMPSLRKIWSGRQACLRRRFVKRCVNYCLQDCHARPESARLSCIVRKRI